MRGLLVALVLLAGVARADDGGGRDVSVAVFSTRALHAVTLSPAGAQAWMAKCATCAHLPMKSAWSSGDSREIFAGGTLRLRDEASGQERVASGLWHVKRVGTELDAVLTLPSERYVAMVVGAEADAKEPAESLRAMAVVVRTYALNGSHYTARPGHLSAELCDSTQCQAMRWGGESAAVDEAVRATAGETLWSGGKRAEVYFSGSCGGQAADAGAVWPALRGTSYLRAHSDPYCVRRDGGAKWHTEIALSDLMNIAKAEGWKLPPHINAVRVARGDEWAPRTQQVTFLGGGEADSLAASALRFGVGRALGFGKIRSDWYDVSVRGESLVFDGQGHGHGVGLCQSGAMEMAIEGKRAAEILGFYFPGTVVGLSAKGEVWRESMEGGVAVRSVGAAPDVRGVWEEALRKFPGSEPVEPTVIFAPTVEMFRQRSGQPGWMVASTRGDVIVVQPVAVVGAGMRNVLLHEMLHVLVESEAAPGAPLWLREGLVEALAGEAGARSMSDAEMERALANPASREASERAHRAAAGRVKMLLAKFGAGAVRGWLRSGVPAGV